MGRREKAALMAAQMALPMVAGFATSGAFGKASKGIATACRALSAAITAALTEDGASGAPMRASRPNPRRAAKRA